MRSDTETMTIGSAEGNDRVLAVPTVSRFHRELRRGEDGAIAIDTGSTNGTGYEGAQIERATFPRPARSSRSAAATRVRSSSVAWSRWRTATTRRCSRRASSGELERAKETIARLQGVARRADPRTTIEHDQVVGGPALYVREEKLPYDISEAGYEAIAGVLRTKLGAQNVSQVGRTLTVPGVFSLTREGGRTGIRMMASWRMLRGSVFAIGGLTTIFGGLMTTSVLVEAANHGGAHWLPFLALAVVPVLAGSSPLLGRRITAKRSQRGLETHQGAFETILAVAAEHRVEPAVRARVEALGEIEAEVAAASCDAEEAR